MLFFCTSFVLKGKYKYRNEKKTHQTNNSNETSVEHLLYIGLFLVTVDVISKYSLPIQHEVILKKNGGCITRTL
jgi:hypothetical protein